MGSVGEIISNLSQGSWASTERGEQAHLIHPHHRRVFGQIRRIDFTRQPCVYQTYFLNVAAVIAVVIARVIAQGKKTAIGLSEKGRDR
ncbi:hypothetical protein D3C71_1991870 [compost metagenome]